MFAFVPEGLGFAVELGIFAIIIGLVCLRAGYQHTIGAALHAVAGVFNALNLTIPLPNPFSNISFGLGFIGEAILDLDNSIMATMGAAIGRSEWAAKNVWNWTATIAEEATNVVAELAEATYGAFGQLRRYTIPALITAYIGAALKGLHWTTQKITQIERHPVQIITKTLDVARPELNALNREVAHLEAQVAALDVPAITHPLPIPIPRVGDITRGVGQLWGDVRRIAGYLTPAGIVGLVAAASLSTLGLGWLKCRGVNRAGHALCGLSGLLETLLGDAIDALVVADLCQFTEALAYAARKFEPVLIGFVDVEDALIGCGGSSRPAMPSVGTLSLPPVTGFVLS